MRKRELGRVRGKGEEGKGGIRGREKKERREKEGGMKVCYEPENDE